MQRALAQLQPSDRAIQAVWSGVPGQSNLSLRAARPDRARRDEPILGQKPFGVIVFRAGDVGRGVRQPRRGRRARALARSPQRPAAAPCTPSNCELIQIGGAPAAPKLPFLHVVGRAVVQGRRAALRVLRRAAAAGGRRSSLADGVVPFDRSPLPDARARSRARTAGSSPSRRASIHDWQLASLGTRLDRAQSQLERALRHLQRSSRRPDTIAAIRATSRVAGERLLILGGDAAVLLLGFAVLASTRLRRDQRDVRRRLTGWARGARRSCSSRRPRSSCITVAASVVGWAAGTGAGALLARHLGSPGGARRRALDPHRPRALDRRRARRVTAAVMLAALRADCVAFGGLRVTVADVAALGALAAVLLALARGKADATALQGSGGTGVCPAAAAGLVLFVLAVVVARLLAPLLRLLEWRRAARRRACASRCSRSRARRARSCSRSSSSCSASASRSSRSRTARRSCRASASRRATPCRRRIVLQRGLEQLVTIQQAARDARPDDAGRCATRATSPATAAATSRCSRCPRGAAARSTAGAPTSPRRRRRARARCSARRHAGAARHRLPRGAHADVAVHDHRRPRRVGCDRREPARRLHAARVRRARPAARTRRRSRSRRRRAAGSSSRSASRSR